MGSLPPSGGGEVGQVGLVCPSPRSPRACYPLGSLPSLVQCLQMQGETGSGCMPPVCLGAKEGGGSHSGEVSLGTGRLGLSKQSHLPGAGFRAPGELVLYLRKGALG